MVGALLWNGLGVALARVTEGDPQDIAHAGFAIGSGEGADDAEIDLRLLTWGAFHAPDASRCGGLELADVALDRLVGMGEARLTLEIGMDALCGESLRELALDEIVKSQALALAHARVGRWRRLRAFVG